LHRAGSIESYNFKEEMHVSALPVDDIGLVYGRADDLRKNAVSEVLRETSFLLSCEGGYTVIAGSNLEKTSSLISGLVVRLEREYGKAFTRALMQVVVSRLDLDEIKKVLQQVFDPSREDGNPQ
jgi:hypothetical protein